MTDENSNKHIIGYGTYFFVWLILIVLTVMTVAVSGVNFGVYSVFMAMLIASVKGFFVLLIFMHLKFEDVVFRIFVGIAFIAFIIFIVLLFFDYSNIR